MAATPSGFAICRFAWYNGRIKPLEAEMKDNSVKLYNMIFPIWMLILLPPVWLVVLPANFAIDLLVIWLTLRYMKIPEIKQNAKAAIVRAWLLGFACDLVGTALMFLSGLPDGQWWAEFSNAVAYDPFSNPLAVLWIVLCIAVSGLCIYFLDYKFAFKKTALDDAQKKKLALSMAIFTAPYLFLLPTAWFV